MGWCRLRDSRPWLSRVFRLRLRPRLLLSLRRPRHLCVRPPRTQAGLSARSPPPTLAAQATLQLPPLLSLPLPPPPSLSAASPQCLLGATQRARLADRRVCDLLSSYCSFVSTSWCPRRGWCSLDIALLADASGSNYFIADCGCTAASSTACPNFSGLDTVTDDQPHQFIIVASKQRITAIGTMRAAVTGYPCGRKHVGPGRRVESR